MTGYVAEMSAAWHAFAACGRARAPAAARGVRDARRRSRRCTPSGSPRAAARPTAVHDPLVCFDTLLLRRAHRRRDAAAWSASTGSSTAPTARSSAPPAPRRSATPVEHALTDGQPGARCSRATLAVAGVTARPELALEFVRRGLAEPPASCWAHLVEHDRAARTYAELLRDDARRGRG